MVAFLHPSQMRFSCQACRRGKSRCQRIDRDDAKCARCRMLQIDCTSGQQKKVGRPRQGAISSRKGADGHGTITPPTSSRGPEEDQSPLVRNHREQSVDKVLGGSRTTSTAPTAVPASDFRDGAIPMTQGWSTTAMEPPRLDSNIWDTFGDGCHTTMPLNMDSDSWFAASGTDSVGPSAATVPHNVSLTTTSWALGAAGEGIEPSEAISRLSKINLDLHIRIAALEMNKADLDLDSFLYAEGPLFIDNKTLVVFTLKTSHEFLQVLTQLLNYPLYFRSGRLQDLETNFPGVPILQRQIDWDSCGGQVPSSSQSLPSPIPELVGSPLALTIISIFTQLIQVYETSVEHMTARMEQISLNPITPIPGLSFAGLPLTDPCTQGMLFTNMTINMLDGMELALGIHKMTQRCGQCLLSPRQIDVLWSELDGAPGSGSGRGAGRPMRVRKMFEEVLVPLTQLSLGR
ncbi:hypothetical protein S7711_07290 [Stachybotrys chartarum IBT 7711]|uniref:Zn(2)-C6 fungal-type domain-containing protein n=1 Tax=Stachybotrys chartarum (strain CBS 109288 / IBT 7711) TaxID=1280523 RepID=A0A084BA04_STACB|nr:hypothetical protein S7711_07290 [Stachybotrys chartarum IBT 7711]